MSEPIRTLWFEDVGFMNEPLLDTPVGRFSIRQTIALLVFGLLAWAVSLLFNDLMMKIVAAGAVFFIGVVVFTRRVKTISPERHLLLLLGIGRPLKKKARKKKKVKKKGRAKPSIPVRTMMVSATLGVPVKVVGVLRDPATGKLLPHRSFDIFVDGQPYSAGATDDNGFFNVFFVPDRYGVFKIEVKPEGFADIAQQITVNVKPKEVTEVA